MPAQHATCLAALQLSAVPSSAPHPALCSCPTNDHPLSYKESCATVDPLASRNPLMPSLAAEHCDCIMRITRGVAQRALIWRTIRVAPPPLSRTILRAMAALIAALDTTGSFCRCCGAAVEGSVGARLALRLPQTQHASGHLPIEVRRCLQMFTSGRLEFINCARTLPMDTPCLAPEVVDVRNM